MTKYRRWTQQEINYLKRNYGKIPVKEIAKRLKGRKEHQIRGKASELHLKSNLQHSKETHRKIALNFIKELKKTAYFPSQELAYIIGVLNGDGYITTNGDNIIGLGNIDKDFALHYKKTLEKWSGLTAHLYPRKEPTYSTGISYRTLLISKKAKEFLIDFYISKNQEKAQKNIEKLLKNDKKLCIKFIEGFFDSEGWIIDTGRIGISVSNVLPINFISNILNRYGIRHKVYSDKYKSRKNFTDKNFKWKSRYNLNIQTKEDVKKFCNLIHSSTKRKQDRIDKFKN